MNIEWITEWRTRRLVRKSHYRKQLATLPPGLEAYWRRSAPLEYRGIRTDAFFFARAAEGLMTFFDVVRRSGRACALPSEAADSVWHAWLRWDQAGLARFCTTCFGRAIPHVERGELGAGALLNTLSICRTLDRVNRHKVYLPALFRLDARLRMPKGHGYWLHGDEILHAPLNGWGLGAATRRPHPELTLHAQYMAGMVSWELLEHHLRQQQRRADGSSCGSSDGDGVLSFGDGGDGGACSDGGDGGGCGGGCGGGD
jgi:hypothetical protein